MILGRINDELLEEFQEMQDDVICALESMDLAVVENRKGNSGSRILNVDDNHMGTDPADDGNGHHISTRSIDHTSGDGVIYDSGIAMGTTDMYRSARASQHHFGDNFLSFHEESNEGNHHRTSILEGLSASSLLSYIPVESLMEIAYRS